MQTYVCGLAKQAFNNSQKLPRNYGHSSIYIFCLAECLILNENRVNFVANTKS